MIKLIAAVVMLLDHIGVILSDNSEIWIPLRSIGRIAMPLYAFCVARGFKYAKAHSTLLRYIRNLFVFSLVSQVPYYFFVGSGLNIGFTWMFAVMCLFNYDRLIDRSWRSDAFFVRFAPAFAILFFLIGAEFAKVDYGASAVVLCLMFYKLDYMNDRSARSSCFAVLISWAMCMILQQSSILQLFSLLGVPVLLWAQKKDNLIRLPKWFSYVFYPAHLTVLCVISYLISL